MIDSHQILVVDDDPDIRSSLVDALASEGYQAHAVANGKEALDRLRASAPPCLILLDLMMPVMDGWRFLAEAETDPALAAIPVVVITASCEQRNDVRTRVMIPKPFRIDTLLEVVAQLC
jgi:CheY-like chemotaxis protein